MNIMAIDFMSIGSQLTIDCVWVKFSLSVNNYFLNFQADIKFTCLGAKARSKEPTSLINLNRLLQLKELWSKTK